MNKTLFRFSSFYKKHDECQKIINEFTDEIINKKINELNENLDNEKNEKIGDEDIRQKMKPVIEILIGNYHEMSHKQIRDEVVTVMIGKYPKKIKKQLNSLYELCSINSN